MKITCIIGALCLSSCLCVGALEDNVRTVYFGIPIVYDGAAALQKLRDCLIDREDRTYGDYAKLFPSRVKPEILAYSLIALVENERDPSRLREARLLLMEIVRLNPTAKVPSEIDWSDAMTLRPIMATMDFHTLKEHNEALRLEVEGENRRVRQQHDASSTNAIIFKGAAQASRWDLYSGRFDGIFPGLRQITFGQLAKEAIERLDKKSASDKAVHH